MPALHSRLAAPVLRGLVWPLVLSNTIKDTSKGNCSVPGTSAGTATVTSTVRLSKSEEQALSVLFLVPVLVPLLSLVEQKKAE